jgi:hypothetical protein
MAMVDGISSGHVLRVVGRMRIGHPMTGTELAPTIELRRFVMRITEDGLRDVPMVELRNAFGHLVWREQTGEIESMFVQPWHRRRGTMRGLWEAAQTIQEVHHSEWRTDDGEAFAKAVGGHLPKRRKA